jgi:hypothetical protein
MARGWESKSIESQMQDGKPHLKSMKKAAAEAPPLSPEARERLGRQHCLELSRTRVERELANCTAERFRAQLEHELEFLNAEIRKLVH